MMTSGSEITSHFNISLIHYCIKNIWKCYDMTIRTFCLLMATPQKIDCVGQHIRVNNSGHLCFVISDSKELRNTTGITKQILSVFI